MVAQATPALCHLPAGARRDKAPSRDSFALWRCHHCGQWVQARACSRKAASSASRSCIHAGCGGFRGTYRTPLSPVPTRKTTLPAFAPKFTGSGCGSGVPNPAPPHHAAGSTLSSAEHRRALPPARHGGIHAPAPVAIRLQTSPEFPLERTGGTPATGARAFALPPMAKRCEKSSSNPRLISPPYPIPGASSPVSSSISFAISSASLSSNATSFSKPSTCLRTVASKNAGVCVVSRCIS